MSRMETSYTWESLDRAQMVGEQGHLFIKLLSLGPCMYTTLDYLILEVGEVGGLVCLSLRGSVKVALYGSRSDKALRACSIL
jgi:hypothetical protein